MKKKDIHTWVCALSKEQRALTNGAFLRWRYGGEFVKDYLVEDDEKYVPDYICWLALQGIELIDAFKPPLLEENIRCLVERFDGLSRIQWGVLRFRPDIVESVRAEGCVDRELLEAWTEENFFAEFPSVAAWLDDQPACGPIGISNSAWLRWSLSPSLRERFDIDTREGALDYACWLLLDSSAADFPTTSWVTEEHVVGLADLAGGLTRLQRIVLDLRPDLKMAFGAGTQIDVEGFQVWWEENFLSEFRHVVERLKDCRLERGVSLSAVAFLRWSQSPILREQFNLADTIDAQRYVCWLLFRDACRITPELLLGAKEIEWLNHSIRGLTLLQRLLLEIRPDLRAAFEVEGVIAIAEYRNWFAERFEVEYPALAECIQALASVRILRGPANIKPARYYNHVTYFEEAGEKPVINLIGYAVAQLGIGEDVRMLYKALQRSGYRINLLDISDEILSDKNENELIADARKVALLGGISIFCCTAPECERLLLRFGLEFFERNYCIGYFPWELSKWPSSWSAAEQLVDRIWVSTSFIYDAFKPVLSKPLVKVPLVVEYKRLPIGKRKDFDLDEDAFVCLFIFDSLSYMARKNPLAHVQAFKQAFCLDENATLVIKTMNRDKTDASLWQGLVSQMEGDARIRLINETMDKEKLLSLYGCVDVYLSLHRAEGFGRTVAEAMLYGKPVVVSAYSGNLDFCNENNACLVPGSLVDVGEDEYPWSEGAVWFNPDVEAAARCLRQLFQEPLLRQAKGLAGQATMQQYRARSVYEKYICPELEAVELERRAIN